MPPSAQPSSSSDVNTPSSTSDLMRSRLPDLQANRSLSDSPTPDPPLPLRFTFAFPFSGPELGIFIEPEVVMKLPKETGLETRGGEGAAVGIGMDEGT